MNFSFLPAQLCNNKIVKIQKIDPLLGSQMTTKAMVIIFEMIIVPNLIMMCATMTCDFLTPQTIIRSNIPFLFSNRNISAVKPHAITNDMFINIPGAKNSV